jgi:hypothetical protein
VMWDWLVKQGVTIAATESTSAYWKPAADLQRLTRDERRIAVGIGRQDPRPSRRRPNRAADPERLGTDGRVTHDGQALASCVELVLIELTTRSRHLRNVSAKSASPGRTIHP